MNSSMAQPLNSSCCVCGNAFVCQNEIFDFSGHTFHIDCQLEYQNVDLLQCSHGEITTLVVDDEENEDNKTLIAVACLVTIFALSILSYALSDQDSGSIR